MSECIFCRIIKGEIPNYTVYENDFVLAFLDIHPHALGHTVVVPKEHLENIKDIDREKWQNILEGVRLTINKIERILKPDGINIGINDRISAGQVVPHMHWHIFPRFNNDGGASVHSIINNPGNKSVEEISKLF